MQLLSSKLKHKIKFIEKNKNIFEDRIEAFAEIMPLNISSYSSLDNANFGLILTEKLFKFTVRYMKEIKEIFYINFNDRTFEIKKINNILEKNIVLEILCLEVTI